MKAILIVSLIFIFIINTVNAQVIDSYTSADSDLPGDIVKAVFVDQHGNKWFGTNQGLAMFDGEIWIVYTDATSHAIAGNVINDIDYQYAPGHGTELWIGTTNGATVAGYNVDGITAATSYRSGDDEVTLVSNNVNAVAVDSAGIRYFGTDDGLAVFEGATWYYFDEESEPDVTDQEILSIDSEEDSIYIGLNGPGMVSAALGIARIINTPDGFTGATPYAFPWNTPSSTVYKVFVDSKGYRWYGTSYGIVRHTGIDGKENKDMLFSSENGLAGDNVYAINEDTEGNIWIGTDMGVSKINPSAEITNYTTSDGLINNTIYDIDVEITNGTVWFATAGGISCMEDGFIPSSVRQKLTNTLSLDIIPSVISESAKIKINLPYNGYLELALYNITGQKINTLFTGYMIQGEQVLSLNVNKINHKGGIYIIRLEMPDNIISRKIVIVN
jgi:hypothetical protein